MSDRHDLRPAPPYDKYGLPGVSYPTNDPSAFAIIVEDVSVASEGYEPLDAYTAHAQTGGSTGIATAVLTLEIAGKGDGNRKNVRRVYETLPGPWVYDTRYDDDLGPVQIRRRPVRFDADNIGSGTATGKTTYTARGESPLVSLETQESWSDGSGDEGNPAYPIRPKAPRYDRERGSVKRWTQVVNPTGEEEATLEFTVDPEPNMDPDVGTVTKTDYEQFGDSLLKKVIETFHVPGPPLPPDIEDGGRWDPETESMVYEQTQLVHTGAPQPDITDLFTGFDPQTLDEVTQRFVVRKYPASVTTHTGIVEFKPDRFVYPAIFHGLTGTVTSIPFDGSIYLESERPISMNARHTTTFTTTAPTAASADSGIVNLLPNRHQITSDTVSFNTGPVLVDAFTLGTITVPASSPSASDYTGHRSAGDYMVIARPSRKLAKGLWAVTEIAIPYR